MASMTITEAVKAAKKQGIEVKGAPKPKAKLPKTKLGGLVDTYRDVRDRRLALSKLVDAIKDEEQRILDHVIENVDADDSRGVVGKEYKGIIQRDEKPIIEDYDAFTAYIKKTGSFEFLNRAVNAASVKERWEAGEEIPGIGHFKFKKLSVTKVK